MNCRARNSGITGGGVVDHPGHRTILLFRGPHGIIVIVFAIMGLRKPLIAGHATGFVADDKDGGYPDVNRSGVVVGSTVAEKPKCSQSPKLLVSSPTARAGPPPWCSFFWSRRGIVCRLVFRVHRRQAVDTMELRVDNRYVSPRVGPSAGGGDSNRDHRAIAWSQPFNERAQSEAAGEEPAHGRRSRKRRMIIHFPPYNPSSLQFHGERRGEIGSSFRRKEKGLNTSISNRPKWRIPPIHVRLC